MAYTKVILTENISTLGAEGDIVRVRRGYAWNFLIPQGKAQEATRASIYLSNQLKKRRVAREAAELEEAQKLAEQIQPLQLSFLLGIGGTGKAFGSISAKDILQKIESHLSNSSLPKHSLHLERPIKETGQHTITLKLHPKVMLTLDIHVAVEEV